MGATEAADPTVGPIGGQAFVEGVMMRRGTAWGAAVRRPDGTIVTTSRRLPEPGVLRRIPLVRGVFALYDTTLLGTRGTMWGAQARGASDGTSFHPVGLVATAVLAFVLVLGVFGLLPAVIVKADEVIPIMGKRVLTQKYCADFLGARNCAWLDKTGEILKETGLLGISMEKVSKTDAAAGLAPGASVDFTQIASIAANRTIAAPDTLAELKLKIDGINGAFLLLSGGRQKREQNVLTVTRESLPDEEAANALPPAVAQFLKPSALVQSDAADIKKQAEKIVRPADSRKVRLEKIVSWVYRNVEKKPVLSVPNALEVLKMKAGDCNEHAVLTAALLRAAGIPAQIETGLVYQNGRFYYHAWNLAYTGRWVTADAVFNQIPADVTHIRLARGEGGQELSLLGVLGKIQLEVLSFK